MTPATANYILTTIFAMAGIFALSASICNWEWFFTNLNVRMLTGDIKRRWARLVYAVLGVIFIATALYLVFYEKY